MGALPPGQIQTKRFPVVGERHPSQDLKDPGAWSLSIGGLVENEARMDLDSFLRVARYEMEFDIHCVTSWSRLSSSWRGLPLGAIAALASPRPEARFVSFTAFSDRGHHTSLPLSVALDSSWLVHEFEGEPLSVEHGGPVRVVTPGRYFYKSIKWVRGIEFLADDRLGWWEANSAYHNNADPSTGKERFTTGSLRPEQLERFLDAASYDKYRGRVMLGLDLKGWRPASRDLQRIYLKNCDLTGIDLAGADLRASNLSLSVLRGADLSSANLSGSDLEGADFTDADLSGADLTGTALSATRFEGARISGARFEGSWGLVESQQLYLAEQGVDFVDS